MKTCLIILVAVLLVTTRANEDDSTREKRDAGSPRLSSTEWLENWLGHLFIKPSSLSGNQVIRDRRQPGNSHAFTHRNNQQERQAIFIPPDMSLFRLEEPITFRPVEKTTTRAVSLNDLGTGIRQQPFPNLLGLQVPLRPQDQQAGPNRGPFNQQQLVFQPDSYFPQQQQIQDEFQQQQQLGTELLAQVPPAPQKPAEGQGVDGSLLEQLLRGEINFSVVGPNALKVDVFLKDKNEQQVQQKRDFVRRN